MGTVLQDVGGYENSNATGINNPGDIVGWSFTGSGFEAVEWSPTGGFTIVGTGDVVYAGLNDAITDGGSSTTIKIGSNVGNLSISGFGSDLTYGVIDLLNGVGGYTTPGQAFAALTRLGRQQTFARKRRIDRHPQRRPDGLARGKLPYRVIERNGILVAGVRQALSATRARRRFITTLDDNRMIIVSLWSRPREKSLTVSGDHAKQRGQGLR